MATKNFNRVAIFKTAWSWVKTTNMTLAEALRKAWANAKVRKLMKAGITHFRFQKVDGTIRDAYGTIAEALVPPTMGTRTAPSTVQVYFDTVKNAWRSFRKDLIIGLA